MIKFLENTYKLQTQNKARGLVVTNCVLKLVMNKIEKELHLFLEKFEITCR